MSRTLLLGIGNVLMGDEGVGVHVARRLEALGLPPNVHVLDGGTGGFHLLGELARYDPVVMIDATMDGQPAGTVSVIEPRYASDFPRTLTAHDIGLRDLIESATLLGQLPRMRLITISIDDMQAMQTTLSTPVAAAVPEVIARIRELVSHDALQSA
ncbi:MAG TPA: hydrogenase maturation protease [Vicinamibacterales bacterium]|nr:hydrogenase maturation protease [Vicinamibacterales bacterium]